MRDKRPVDELSIEELERILAIRKRESRLARAEQRTGRRIPTPQPFVAPLPLDPPPDSESDPVALPQFEDEPTPVAVRPVPIAPPPIPAEPRFEDDLTPRRPKPRPAVTPSQSRLWNRGLMVVEIGSVVGLFIILGVLVVSLADVTRFTNELQADTQRTLQALQIPATATPTINMARVVLPGGHRYDANTNLASFALDEVPAQYRDAYQQFLSIAKPAVQPTQSPESPLNIRIPALGVKSVVVPGDSWEDLKRGVGHHYGSANPGEKGNLVLTAHNDVYGEIFRDLEKLRPGDKIYIATQSREYVYVMRASEVVLPTEVRVLENTQRTLAQITLITCTPYRVDTHRYIVYGELEPQS